MLYLSSAFALHVRCPVPDQQGTTSSCGDRLREWRFALRNASSPSTAMPSPQAPPHRPRPPRNAVVTRNCDDMRWICRSAPRAAVHASLNNASDGRVAPLGPIDAVDVMPNHGIGALPSATVAALPILVGNSANDAATETVSLARQLGLIELPLFHFRKWIDYGVWRPATLDHFSGTSTSFVVKESGFRAGKRRFPAERCPDHGGQHPSC